MLKMHFCEGNLAFQICKSSKFSACGGHFPPLGHEQLISDSASQHLVARITTNGNYSKPANQQTQEGGRPSTKTLSLREHSPDQRIAWSVFTARQCCVDRSHGFSHKNETHFKDQAIELKRAKNYILFFKLIILVCNCLYRYCLLSSISWCRK